MRTKPQTKARRNKRWAPQSLSAPTPKTLPIFGLELPEDALVEVQTDPDRQLVNSGMHYESTLTRELKISANDVPVAPGSWLSDYDGIAHTINKLTAAALNARERLSWCGDTIRSLEIMLWQKECHIAKLEGKEPPPQLAKVPFFDALTNPELTVITKPLINRLLMGLIGAVVGFFGLVCIVILLFFY